MAGLLKKTLFASLLCLQLSAQTFHFGGGASVANTFLLNSDISNGAVDTNYVLSAGYGFQAFAGIYFDNGGYYSKRLFGIKTGVEYAVNSQSYDAFRPYAGPGIPREFYRYRVTINYLEFPLLFNTVSSHHQGFYGEIGPSLGIQQGQFLNLLESNVTDGSQPSISNLTFKRLSLNAIMGLGIYINQTESFGFFGSFRFGYSLFPDALQFDGVKTSVAYHRAWLGINFGASYKINKYDAKKRKRLRKLYGKVA